MSRVLRLALSSGRTVSLDLPEPAADGVSFLCFCAPYSDAAAFWALIDGLCAAAARPVLDIGKALHDEGVGEQDVAWEGWRDLASLRGYVAMAPGPALWSQAGPPTPVRRVAFVRDPRDVVAMAYVDQKAGGPSVADFLSSAATNDSLLTLYRACFSQPRSRDDLVLRYERALDGWREIAVELATFLDLPLTPGETRRLADAAPALATAAPNLRTRDALIETLMDLNGTPETVASVLGFALEALGCAPSSALWRLAGPGPIERSIRRPPLSPAPQEEPLAANVGEPDPVLQFRLRPNARMEREVGGRRLLLETDSYGLRLTLGQPKVGEKLAAFYGCSFTFGTTSLAEETFCSLLQAKMPRWRVENHGVAGYSQSRNLIALERETRFNPADFVAFCWIRDHLRRNVADIGWVQATSRGQISPSGGQPRVATLPRATLDAQGELALTSVHYPRVDLDEVDVGEYEPSPFYLDQVCFKLFERADALVKGYGGRFFVVDLHGHMPPLLTRLLKDANIPLVKTVVRDPKYFVTPTDLHPNALAHQVYAEKIHEYLSEFV